MDFTRRSTLELMIGGLALAGASQARAGSPATAPYDAVLTPNGSPRDGVKGYRTLAEAVAAAPAEAAKPFRILVPAGHWRHRAIIDKPSIELVGEGPDKSLIVFDDWAAKPVAADSPFKPFGAATLVVTAPDFHARDLHIANDWDYPSHIPAPSPYDRTGVSGAQAQALLLTRQSDRAYFHNVRLSGHQDTLWTDSGRNLFEQCQISGSVDFIYGAARSVFDRCTIICRRRPGQEFNGFIAAPSTPADQPYGLVFLDCRIEKEPDVAPQSVALGRPWKQGHRVNGKVESNPRAVGQAVYLRCWMDDHIVPQAWFEMHALAANGSFYMVQPEEARFYEFQSSGPGAGDPAKRPDRRRQLPADQAGAFTREAVLEGWALPSIKTAR